jgi:hypothetical protein
LDEHGVVGQPAHQEEWVVEGVELIGDALKLVVRQDRDERDGRLS